MSLPEALQQFPPDRVDPPDMQAALRGMVDRPFLASRKWEEQQQRAWREEAHPDILEFERCFIKRLKRQGIPAFASEVGRTAERQDELFALGHSLAKAGQSPHQYGCAVDVVHSVKGWGLANNQWALIGHIGKELATQKGIKLVWGGDFKKLYDPAHWEMADWRDQRAEYPFPRVMKWSANWRKLHEQALAALQKQD